MFEGFRRRIEPEISPWPEQIPEAAPEPPLELDVYHVPQRFDPASGGYAPSWATSDLDPQRLDGRSPQPARPREHRAGPAPRESLAEFLAGQTATPPDAPQARLRSAPPTRPARPAPADTGRGPIVRPKPAETVRFRSRSLFREAARVGDRPPPDPKAPPAPRGQTAAAPAFPRLRVFPPAALAGAGLDVQTRPRRTYPVRWPGTSRETRVRPEYHGVGLARSATPTHTRGLALLFPPHTVHAQDSTSAGATCELAGVDHVHIRQAVVGPDDALRSGRVEEVLARAAAGDLRDVPGGPPRAERVSAVHEAETVQLGDDALTRLDSRYVVERTFIPAGALLAGRPELARRYLDLITGTPDDPVAVAGFLGDLVGAAADATRGNVLGYADGLPEQRAAVLGLFGLVTLDRATSVLVGAGEGRSTGLDLGAACPSPQTLVVSRELR